MLKKTIKYTDYDDVTREDTFYFNLSEAELIQMNFNADGGLEQMLEKIVRAKDMKSISELIKSIILKSYGKKSADGFRFIKSREASESFEQSQAFSDLYVELISDANKMSDFILGVIPPKFAASVETTPQ